MNAKPLYRVTSYSWVFGEQRIYDRVTVRADSEQEALAAAQRKGMKLVRDDMTLKVEELADGE